MSRSEHRRFILNFPKYIVFGLIVFCFIKGTVQNNSHHCEQHNDLIVLHTEKQESDPCHRSIYHGDRKTGCMHSSHLTKGIQKCGLEELYTIIQLDFVALKVPKNLNFVQSGNENLTDHISIVRSELNTIRGPPQVFIYLV
ncbi:MAG: hypothetical protein ABI851_14715 [Saprospiraceae bacterium]